MRTLFPAVVIAGLLTSTAPLAAADHTSCDSEEVLGVDEDWLLRACADAGTATVATSGTTLVPTACERVPEIRVLGDRIPETGQLFCTPSGVPSFQGTAPFLVVCLYQGGITGLTGICIASCTAFMTMSCQRDLTPVSLP